jgi:hypothetical protein
MSYQKCPVCDGRGATEECGVRTKCTVCEGKKIISELTGRPPKFTDKTLISNGREYNIVDADKMYKQSKDIVEQMKIARNKYLLDVQKQENELIESRWDEKFRNLHDVPADIQNIIDNNFKDLIE